jgi:hypothetical protein
MAILRASFDNIFCKRNHLKTLGQDRQLRVESGHSLEPPECRQGGVAICVGIEFRGGEQVSARCSTQIKGILVRVLSVTTRVWPPYYPAPVGSKTAANHHV